MSGENLQLGRIFYQFNNFLENDMEDGKFMTMFMGVYDPATSELTYVSCGHDEPMHYHAATGAFTVAHGSGLTRDRRLRKGKTQTFGPVARAS